MTIKNTHTKHQGYIEYVRTIFDNYFNQNISTFYLVYRVRIHTMRKPSTTSIYIKFDIANTKKLLDHVEIDTTMKYMEISDYGS